MENKTMSLMLWSLPVECADMVIGKLRNLASTYILNGEDEMAEKLLRCIVDAEEQVQKEREAFDHDLD